MARAKPGADPNEPDSSLPTAIPICCRTLYRGREVAVFFTLHRAARWLLHEHRVFQIVVLAENARGTLSWRGPKGRLVHRPFKGAHVWIVPPGTAHAARLEAPAAIVVLLVRADFVRRVTAEPLTSCSLEPLEHYLQADDVVSVLGRRFLSWCHESRRQPKGYVVSAGGMLAHHVITAHLAPREHVRTQPRGLAPSVLKIARAYFQEHMVEGVDVHRLARSLQMSPGHFGRMFKLSQGVTPSDHLGELRRAKAEQLLASGRYQSVTEVAHAVGCYDHSHLNKLFRKKYDLPAGLFLRKRAEP